MFNLFINTYVKFFFLLTPFFVISMFLALTRDMKVQTRQSLAHRTSIAIVVTVFILFYFGNYIFKVLGITLPAFQIGAGALLFLSAVSLLHGDKPPRASENEDLSVVPLAIPLTVGPGTTGTLLVMGIEVSGTEKLVASAGLLLAVMSMGALLHFAYAVERFLGAKGLSVLTKLTGLVLAALAAQIIFTGIHNFGKAV